MKKSRSVMGLAVVARRGKRTKAGRKARFRLHQQRGGR